MSARVYEVRNFGGGMILRQQGDPRADRARAAQFVKSVSEGRSWLAPRQADPFYIDGWQIPAGFYMFTTTNECLFDFSRARHEFREGRFRLVGYPAWRRVR